MNYALFMLLFFIIGFSPLLSPNCESATRLIAFDMLSAPNFIVNDSIHHLKSYNVYRKKSTEQQATFKLIEEKLPDPLKCTWEGSATPNTFNIMAVGCGDGYGGDFLVLDIVKKFSLAWSQKLAVLTHAIEPHSDALAIYQASAESWAERNKAVEACFEWYPGSWQEYLTKTKHELKKFDLIHFIHSIYFVDLEEVLRDCIENKLTDNGIVCCFISDVACPLDACEAFPVNFPTKEAVVSIANKNGWKWESFALDFNIDVTEIIDESSEQGNLLLDFLTLTINYRSVTDQSKVKQLEEFFWKISATDSNGKRRLGCKLYAILVSKA